MLRNIIVIIVLSRFACCINHEQEDYIQVENKGTARSSPPYKVPYYDSKNQKKVYTNKGEPQKSAKIIIRYEPTDNVRVMTPISREDIRMIKKLSFHGRTPPSSTNNKNTTVGMSRSSSPKQFNLNHRKYEHQQKFDSERNRINNIRVTDKKFIPKEKGFLPLFNPSPISIQPIEPRSFETTRNYVDFLKMRNQKYYDELDEDSNEDINQEPNEEIEYFVKREKELVEEQRPKLEREFIATESGDIESINDQNIDENMNRQNVEVYNNENENDDNEDQMSLRNEKFIPFRLYAQVRHVEAESHKPKSYASHPQAKERLTLEKKNLYYKEEGFEDTDYNHGSEKVNSHFRVRRDAEEEVEQPMALAIIKKSDLPELTGEKLLKQLDELLKKTSLYLPDDDDEDDVTDNESRRKRRLSKTIYGTKTNTKSHKYPYYNLPDSQTLDTMSAFRYSENIRNFPRAKESLYNFKNAKICEDIDRDINPVPHDIEEKGKRTSYNKSPQRLNDLGEKISCYKTKYFGKEPFDNPLFKEKYVAASIPIPLKDSTVIPHQVNPLITVYDDVISNIRAAFADELKKKQEEEALRTTTTTLAPLPVTKPYSYSKVSAPDIRIVNLNYSPGAGSIRLPLYDATNYYPKPNVTAKIETSSTPSIKYAYKLEYFDKPIPDPSGHQTINQKAGEKVIKNLRPPNLQPDHRRRRNPANQKNFQQVRSQTVSHYLQPPNAANERFKFKLL